MSRGAPLVASADSGPPIRPPPAGRRRQQFKAGSRSHQGARTWLRRSPFRGPCAGRLATAVHSPDPFLTRWLRRASPAAFAAYCIAAAFGAYFCMYAFRKPWSAATFEGQQLLGRGLFGVHPANPRSRCSIALQELVEHRGLIVTAGQVERAADGAPEAGPCGCLEPQLPGAKGGLQALTRGLPDGPDHPEVPDGGAVGAGASFDHEHGEAATGAGPRRGEPHDAPAPR